MFSNIVNNSLDIDLKTIYFNGGPIRHEKSSVGANTRLASDAPSLPGNHPVPNLDVNNDLADLGVGFEKTGCLLNLVKPETRAISGFN